MAEIDSIIQKYIQDKTSEEENQQLHRWMQASPENKKRFFAEKDIWDSYGFQANVKKYNPALELELLTNRRASITSKPIIRLKQFIQIAAILLVTFGLGWGTQFIPFDGGRQQKVVEMKEIFTPKGQVNQVFLADGTRIWINSDTRLSVPDVFSDEERVVKLSGEAFFEVAKDNKRPFKVEVNGQQIEVLGTSFNINAYAASNKTETTLQTGRIRLHTDKQTTNLAPGEQAVFDRSARQLTIRKVNPLSFSSWKDGRYEFHNEDLLEVFELVERWYDVEITADEEYFKGMQFSGVIKRNKDAQHFVELLNLSIPVQYEIKGDKIQISPK